MLTKKQACMIHSVRFTVVLDTNVVYPVIIHHSPLHRVDFKLPQSKYIILFHGLYFDARVDSSLGRNDKRQNTMLNNGTKVEQLYQY